YQRPTSSIATETSSKSILGGSKRQSLRTILQSSFEIELGGVILCGSRSRLIIWHETSHRAGKSKNKRHRSADQPRHRAPDQRRGSERCTRGERGARQDSRGR